MIKPVSSLCNMRCAYCFYADVSRNRRISNIGTMSDQTLEKVVRKAFVYADGCVSFVFQGGEPTLAGLDFYRLLVRLQKQYNTRRLLVTNSLQTNGYALDDAFAAFFAEHRFLVGISLDGTREIHDAQRKDTLGKGTYDQVLNGITCLKRHGADYNILCVVNTFAAHSARQVFENLRTHTFLQFIPCLDSLDKQSQIDSLSPEDYGNFLIETFDLYARAFGGARPVSVRDFDVYVGMLRGHPPESCAQAGACAAYALVESDGGVYPCDFYALDEYLLGNIHDMSFSRLFHTSKMRMFLESSRSVPPECEACDYYSLCRGGCRRYREPFVAGAPSLNRFCSGYKRFFAHAGPALRAMALARNRMG